MKRWTRQEWIVWLPLAMVLLYVASMNLIGLGRNLLVPQPRNPWEAISTVEAWRTMVGLELYPDLQTGHVTQVYGAMAPVVLGWFMRVAGVTNQAGRLLSLSAAVGLIALLLPVAARGQGRGVAVTGMILFLGLDSLTHNYFVENRPDLVMLFFGAGAVLLMAHGYQTRNWLAYGLGIVVMLLAFFQKQTAISIAFIVALAILTDSTMRLRARIVVAALPICALGLVLVALALFFPNIFVIMVGLHWQYTPTLAEVVRLSFELIGFVPLFVILFWDWLHAPGSHAWQMPQWRWSLAAIIGLVPGAAAGVAEPGGTTNSALPLLIAMIFFCVLCLGTQFERLRAVEIPWTRRLIWNAALALAILFTFPTAHLNVGFVPVYDEYAEVIAQTRALHASPLASPEDPTLALYAQGTFSQSIYAEIDLLGYPDEITPRVARELDHAAAVVDVKYWWLDLVTPADLEARGFVLVQEWEHYGLWTKKQ